MLGRALAFLRAEAGLTQERAGEAFGASGQNWQKYEAGKAPSIFQPGVQRRLTSAIGVTVEDLMLARERLQQEGGAAPRPPRPRATGLAEPGGRRFDGPRGRAPADLKPLLAQVFGPTSRVLQMPDDTLRPWAASGCTIVYDTELWPRREEGCVVHTDDGQLHVKLFLSAEPETVRVRELHPQARDLAFPRTAGVGVFRVVARIDLA